MLTDGVHLFGDETVEYCVGHLRCKACRELRNASWYINMASLRSQEMLSSVEKKKQELLRRVQEKKAGTSSVSSKNTQILSSSSNVIPATNSLFNNDGNFLARFQAMQKQMSPQEQNTNSLISSSEASPKDKKMTVTMKVVKKPTPPAKVKPSRLDVFDVPDGDDDETGNFLVFCKVVGFRSNQLSYCRLFLSVFLIRYV